MTLQEYFNSAPTPAAIRQPFIIAEAGVNHEGSMDIARRLIAEAKEGGADAIKFQTYRASKLAAKDSPAYWDTSKEPATNQYELFSRHDSFGAREYQLLKAYCDEVGIEFLSTPFDSTSADFLDPLMAAYKISSSDITNRPFIEYLCDFKKPVILSTGASSFDEIREAVEWIAAKGNKLALLHCVLNYPTADKDANLSMITELYRQFHRYHIGYSDHTVPGEMKVLELATLLGATLIEKHFTHDKTLPGNDHYHAMDKEDLKLFRTKVEDDLTLLGKGQDHSLASQEQARQHARRSLVSEGLIPEGTIITRDMITWKRPASGISPKYIDQLIGRRAARNIADDTILSWDMID